MDFGGEGRDINTTTADEGWEREEEERRMGGQREREGEGERGRGGRGREREGERGRERENEQVLMNNNHKCHSPITHVYNILPGEQDLTSYLSNFTSHAYQLVLSADVLFDSCSHRSPVEPSAHMRNDTYSVTNWSTGTSMHCL